MKLLNIEDIAPELSYPGVWSQKNLVFLKSILACCSHNRKVIRSKDLSYIGTEIVKNMNSMFGNEAGGVKYSFTKLEQAACNKVIEVLQNFGWMCSFYQLKVKVSRPSVIPTNKRDLEIINKVNTRRDLFWKGKIPFNSNVKSMLAVEILVGCGLHHPNLLRQSIEPEMFSEKGYLCFPIAKGSTREMRIPLSSRATLLSEYVKSNPVMLLQHADYGSRYSILASQLYFYGLEAVLYSQLQRAQLPVPLPEIGDSDPIVFRYTKKDFKRVNAGIEFPKIIKRERRRKPVSEVSSDNQATINTDQQALPTQKNSLVLLPELGYQLDDVEGVIPWKQESLITLGQIRFQLKAFLTDKNGVYRNGKLSASQVESVLNNAVRNTIDRAKQRALLSASIDKDEVEKTIDIIRQSHTSLALACSRIHYHLCEKQNSLETCLAEINSVFEHGFVLYPVVDLRAWDEEDIELVINELLLERKKKELSERTKVDYLNSLRRVILFSRRELALFNNIELPEVNAQTGIVLTNRNHVLGPSEFDNLTLNKIKLHRLTDAINPTLILAFYGGMRSGEIANLSLRDIVCSEYELIVYVRKGKTPSAKRSIPLHLIAPPKAVKIVRDYYQLRMINYRAYKNKKEKSKQPDNDKSQVQFLSINGDCSQNTSALVIEQSLSSLKDQIGNGADLHLLRHSFASMMFLRWYCCKHPDFINELVDEKHWCFKKQGIASLRVIFGENPNEPLPDSNTTAIIHLIKLMGHRDTNTFFQVYVHSYDAVLEHALKRVHSEIDKIALPGKLISELVPNMKSRKSQLKLKSRQASYLSTI